MHTYKAVVIGAGVAGMAAAIRLAVQGFEVTVFEQNSYPGGKLSRFEQDGYSFDAGPSLFTEPGNLHQLFAYAGEDLHAFLQYQPQSVACRYFYENGTVVEAFARPQQLATELATKLGESPAAVLAYLARAEALYTRVGQVFLNHSLHRKSTWWKAPIRKALQTVKPAELLKTLQQVNHRVFNNPQTVQLFNRYATYNGSNPYQAPGMLRMIPHLEHNDGTYYPKGGMISITHALYALAVKKGVRFHLGTPVQRIICPGGRAAGVVANNENLLFDVVISNMDAYLTYRHLLKDEASAGKLARQERSSSALIFYWGIGGSFPQLQLHNIFFSADYRKEFAAIFNTGNITPDPTVYVNITAKCEPGVHAPEGKENWFVMVNVPANTGQNWQQLQQQCRGYVLQKLSRLLQTDIASLIETESVLDPQLIESRTASYCGSLYGTSSNSRMAAFLRHPNFARSIERLYFVGGSVHPGGGIPLCLRSAAIAGELVQQDRRNWHHPHN